jgi:hypothetical protein
MEDSQQIIPLEQKVNLFLWFLGAVDSRHVGNLLVISALTFSPEPDNALCLLAIDGDPARVLPRHSHPSLSPKSSFHDI